MVEAACKGKVSVVEVVVVLVVVEVVEEVEEVDVVVVVELLVVVELDGVDVDVMGSVVVLFPSETTSRRKPRRESSVSIMSAKPSFASIH